MTSRVAVDHDEAMATADKEMEERANRARQLLSDRYRGLRNDQVSTCCHESFVRSLTFSTLSHRS